MADVTTHSKTPARSGQLEPPRATAARRILVVCRGNTCRSAMAEGVLREALARAGLSESVTVASAGTAASAAAQGSADPRAIAAAAAAGIDISAHRTSALADYDLAAFDLILVADRYNLDLVRAALPAGAHDKAQLLLDLDPALCGEDLRDPFMGELSDYEMALTLIKRAAVQLVKHEARNSRRT